MTGCLIDTEHISTDFGKGQGTYPITKQLSKLHQQARYKLPDIIIQTVQRWHKKLQTISNSRNEKPLQHSAPPPPLYEHTSTILHRQQRNNKHLQQGQNMNTLQVIIQEQGDAEPWTRTDDQPFKQSHIHQSYPSANERT